MAKGPRENRIPIMMSDEEVTAIDDWRFAHRVATRSDAVRRLAQIALAFDDKADALTDALMDSAAQADNCLKWLDQNPPPADQKHTPWGRLHAFMTSFSDHLSVKLHETAYPLWMITQAVKAMKGPDPFESVRQKAEQILRQTDRPVDIQEARGDKT